MAEKQPESRTNVNDFVGELNAGILVNQLGDTLSEAARATILHGKGTKKGKVTLELTFSQIGDNNQVLVTSKLSKSVPTPRGKKSEENASDTPMYAGKGGVLTIDVPREEDSGQFNLHHQIDSSVIKNNVRKIAE